MVALLILTIVLAASQVSAQGIQVYSELRRVGPDGEVIPQDSGGFPREILSPLLARNSHASFRVVVDAPPGEHFYVYVGTNPEGVFPIKLYKEMWRKQGDGWIPDRLLPLNEPYLSHIPDRYHGIASQAVESFLVDIFVPADTKPGRVKLEPQVNIGGTWIIYPMEVRISTKVVPRHRFTNRRLPRMDKRADHAVLGPVREFLCGAPETGRNGYPGIRHIIRRNAVEDMALARELEKTLGADAVATGLLRGLNMDRATFCATEDDSLKSSFGPEWYLRGRDFLYKSDLSW